jgi:hypothetical protein
MPYVEIIIKSSHVDPSIIPRYSLDGREAGSNDYLNSKQRALLDQQKKNDLSCRTSIPTGSIGPHWGTSRRRNTR